MTAANPHPGVDARPPPAESGVATCLHCGSPAPAPPPGQDPFCCSGCEAAHALIEGLGLAAYYRRRVIDPQQRVPRPEEATPIDYATYVRDEGEGIGVLNLIVEGLHCAACVWLIESILARQPGVLSARINMTTRRLTLRWRKDETDPDALAAMINGLGYRLVPYDPALLDRESAQRDKALLRAMAVAGFAAGNIMLLSVSVWAGAVEGMGPATRDLFHWISAAIGLPAIAYAGRPFFRSALGVLRAGHVNMDVPISLAVVLAAGMSLYETVVGSAHVYFDSATALLFFLLAGRYLDSRARGRARSAAEQLLALQAGAVAVLDAEGCTHLVPPTQVTPGMRVAAAAGERIAVDGRVHEGQSDIDTALINGETVPTPAAAGTEVFAGTLNLSGPLVIEVTAVGEDTLLAEITRLVEAAEQARGRYVALADRIARLYAPVVHALAAATFLGWWWLAGAGWQVALLNAIAVLIITCPCALGLAVPVVQVVASGRLLRQGILVKSATALERLAAADWLVFDKTGTLTQGKPELVTVPPQDEAVLAQAVALAAVSRHPLARALVRAAEARGLAVAAAAGVREIPGHGLEMPAGEGRIRLGSRRWCAVGENAEATGPELWLSRPGAAPVRFTFADRPRRDAREVVAALRQRGLRLELLSGDRAPTVAALAAEIGIDDWQADCDPASKCRRLAALAAEGRRVVMVGDGLNDAPALAAAHASMSPSSAVDLSQTAADVVFQGERLAPVVETLDVARRAGWLVRENFALAFAYNVVTVPLAVAGLASPLVAAIAMSASSLVVIANALRLGRGGAS